MPPTEPQASNLYGVAGSAAPGSLLPGGRVPTPVRRAPREWMDKALCARHDPGIWERSAQVELARHLCVRHCPVVADCKVWARDQVWHENVVGGDYWLSGGHNRARKPRAMDTTGWSARPECPLCKTAEPCTPSSAASSKSPRRRSSRTRATPGAAG